MRANGPRACRTRVAHRGPKSKLPKRAGLYAGRGPHLPLYTGNVNTFVGARFFFSYYYLGHSLPLTKDTRYHDLRAQNAARTRETKRTFN